VTRRIGELVTSCVAKDSTFGKASADRSAGQDGGEKGGTELQKALTVLWLEIFQATRFSIGLNSLAFYEPFQKSDGVPEFSAAPIKLPHGTIENLDCFFRTGCLFCGCIVCRWASGEG